MPATVSLPLEELDGIRNENKRMSAEIADLQKQLTEAKLDGGNPEVTRAMAKLSRASLDIVSFAIGNLSPEVIKRWPFASLRVVAENLKNLPDCTIHDEEFAFVWMKFAAECEAWEKKRERDGDTYVPPPGPETPSLEELMKQSQPESQT